MDIETATTENVQAVTWGPTSIPQEVVSALNTFTNTPRKAWVDTTWYSMCTTAPSARVFFKGGRENMMSRLLACQIAADAYANLGMQTEVDVINPRVVVKVRDQAKSMRAVLPAQQYLPAPANTVEFRTGLDSLCQWTRPANAPSSNSGDPCVRAFILGLAHRFADAFVDIPVEYIHNLVIIGWPTRSLSATRRVLTATVTAGIKIDVEATRVRESAARGTTALTIHKAASSRYLMSISDQQEVEQLSIEIDRIRQGRRRFPSDAARLRALNDIAQSLDDPDLKADVLCMISDRLKEFSP